MLLQRHTGVSKTDTQASFMQAQRADSHAYRHKRHEKNTFVVVCSRGGHVCELPLTVSYGWQVSDQAVTCHTDVLLLCSAARALARKLAEEKQAAINAAKNAAEHSMDEEELEAIKQSVEQATADAAREAARADALARAACQQGPSASSHLQDLERLKVCVSSPQVAFVLRQSLLLFIFSGNQA